MAIIADGRPGYGDCHPPDAETQTSTRHGTVLTSWCEKGNVEQLENRSFLFRGRMSVPLYAAVFLEALYVPASWNADRFAGKGGGDPSQEYRSTAYTVYVVYYAHRLSENSLRFNSSRAFSSLQFLVSTPGNAYSACVFRISACAKLGT